MPTTITASFLKPRRTPIDHSAKASAGATFKVRTLFGWTPGVRSLVAGRVLTCGCLIGVYETQTGAIVEIFDACGPVCPHADHVMNGVLHPEALNMG